MESKTTSADASPDSSPAEGLDPLRLFAQLPLRPYHCVLDLRCGNGHLTIPMAKSLFDGRVYARDGSAAALDELKQRLAQARLSNVTLVSTEKEQQSIGDDTLDGVLVPFALHQTADREGLLREFLPKLKRSAWVAIVEWQKGQAAVGPPDEERIAEADVMALAKTVGLRISGRRTLTSNYYLVLLRK